MATLPLYLPINQTDNMVIFYTPTALGEGESNIETFYSSMI